MSRRSEKIKVVGLGGSLGKKSLTLSVLNISLQGAKQGGAEVELLDLRELSLPFYNPEIKLEEYPENVSRFLNKVREADGMIWASPAYHGTVSGAMKNALDFLEFLAKDQPPYLTDKVVGLITTSGGSLAGVNAINALNHICQALRAWVVPLMIPVIQAWKYFDEEGRITDPLLEERLILLGVELVKKLKHC
jgi:FMN reductase